MLLAALGQVLLHGVVDLLDLLVHVVALQLALRQDQAQGGGGVAHIFIDALPIFGSGSVMVPWAIITACNGDIRLAISIFVLWIIMSVVRQFIEPRIVGNHIGIHPIFTLIAMYTGFKVSGVIGLFIGPIALIILKNIFSNLLDKGVVKSIFSRDYS